MRFRALALKNAIEASERLGRPAVLQNVLGLIDIAIAWLIILIAVIVSVGSQSTFAYALAILTIASQQHAIATLLHDAAHRHLFSNSTVNDLLSDFFCAMPLFVVTKNYRYFHLLHHAHLGSERDPDFKSKDPKIWSFPKSSWLSLLGFTLKIWFQRGVVGTLRLIYQSARPVNYRRAFYLRLVAIVLTYLVAIHFLISWHLFFFYWIVPGFTIFPILGLVRSAAEHFGLPNDDVLRSSRDISCHPIEAALFGPHSSHYHLTHHLVPESPRYRLREVHTRLMMDPDFRTKAKLNRSYFTSSSGSVVADLLVTRSARKP